MKHRFLEVFGIQMTLLSAVLVLAVGLSAGLGYVELGLGDVFRVNESKILAQEQLFEKLDCIIPVVV